MNDLGIGFVIGFVVGVLFCSLLVILKSRE